MCRVVATSRVIVPRRRPGMGGHHPLHLDGRPRPLRMLQPPQVGTVDRPRYASLTGKELGHTMVIDVGERESRSFMMLARHWHSHLLDTPTTPDPPRDVSATALSLRWSTQSNTSGISYVFQVATSHTAKVSAPTGHRIEPASVPRVPADSIFLDGQSHPPSILRGAFLRQE